VHLPDASSCCTQAETFANHPTTEDFDRMVALVEGDHYSALLSSDQLHKEMAAHNVFLGFKEGAISFPPTFKVRVLPSWGHLSNTSWPRDILS
jgi:hypothetical protein